MATITVAATASALSTNAPYDVVDLTFTYSGTTVQNGTTLYYSAHLSNGTVSEDVLFPLTVTSGSNIPASEEFAYTPGVTFTTTVAATDGKVYYTA